MTRARPSTDQAVIQAGSPFDAVGLTIRQVQGDRGGAFHGELYGVTANSSFVTELSNFDAGFLIGLLVGEGHFGGDSRQAHVVLRMHVRHEPMLRRLAAQVVGSKVYGPYNHGGRRYFQLMFRGPALRETIVPLLESAPWRTIDPHTFARYLAMKEKYALNTTVMTSMDELLAAALPANSLYAVGGRVRDELRAALGQTELQQKDSDYVVTGISLADLQKRLQLLGRVDVVGASFAVIKFTKGGQTVDIALPRRERSVGVGHREFEVDSGPDIPLEDDLARRDFRMNMMARAIPSGRIVDPYNGADDVREMQIDLLGPQAFEEDPLRMLRAAQFAARFGYRITDATLAAMRASAALVTTVSAERIGDELTKLLQLAPSPSVGLEVLRETGILAHLWPELLEGVDMEQNEWHAYDVYRHTLATVDATPPGDLVLRLAALFHDVGKPRVKDGPHFYRHEHVGEELVRSMLGRFRFSREVIETVAHLVRSHMYSADPALSDAAVRRFIRRIGTAHLERQFALRAADVAGSGLPKRGTHNEEFAQRVWDEVQRAPAFSVADLQIDGADVIAAMVSRGLAAPGYRGDARVGAALQWLFEQVTDQPERNERTSLLALLESYLDAS